MDTNWKFDFNNNDVQLTASELKHNEHIDRELRELTEKLQNENSALLKMLELLNRLRKSESEKR